MVVLKRLQLDFQPGFLSLQYWIECCIIIFCNSFLVRSKSIIWVLKQKPFSKFCFWPKGNLFPFCGHIEVWKLQYHVSVQIWTNTLSNLKCYLHPSCALLPAPASVLIKYDFNFNALIWINLSIITILIISLLWFYLYLFILWYIQSNIFRNVWNVFYPFYIYHSAWPSLELEVFLEEQQQRNLEIQCDPLHQEWLWPLYNSSWYHIWGQFLQGSSRVGCAIAE